VQFYILEGRDAVFLALLSIPELAYTLQSLWAIGDYSIDPFPDAPSHLPGLIHSPHKDRMVRRLGIFQESVPQRSHKTPPRNTKRHSGNPEKFPSVKRIEADQRHRKARQQLLAKRKIVALEKISLLEPSAD
jgi:hypothetical protein